MPPFKRGVRRPHARLAVFVAAFFIAVVLPVRAIAQVVAFASKVDVAAAGNVRAVAVADLNADGRPDLVTANGTAHSVSVFLSTGSGTFGPKVNYPTGFVPVSLVTADINRDGRLDVITANNGGASVSLLLGTGGGALGFKNDFTTGNEPCGMAVADLNGDGNLDVVTANAGTGGISVLLGTGFGAFAAKSDFAASGRPQAVTIADVNGDGRPDVITANAVAIPGGPPFPGGNNVSVLLNGTFNQHTDFPAGTTPSAVTTTDLNRDGRLDLVVANDGSNSLSVMLGTGTGSFGPKTEYDTATRPQALAVGDVNGDGKPDVAAVSLTTSTVSVFRIPGFGSLGSRIDFVAGNGPVAVAVADVNADAKPDLITANHDAASVSILANTTEFTQSGWFQGFKVPFDTSSSPAGFAVGDLSGDGKPDLAVTNRTANTVSVILDVTYLGVGIRTDYFTGLSPIAVALADLNRDGRSDLVTANQAASTVSVLLGTGAGAFGPKTDFPTGSAPADVAAGDVNSDGIPDIVTANSTADTVSVLLGIGNGMFAPKVDFATGAAPIGVELAEVTGDGRPDLLVLNAFAFTVSVLPGAATGLFGPRVDFATGFFPSDIAVGDVNNDGRLDVAVANRASDTAGSVTVLLGAGMGTFQLAAGPIPIPADPRAIALGDVNRDGRLDLAVTTLSDNTASVLLGFGDGQFQARNIFPTAYAPVDVALADIDVDGKVDLVVVNDDHVTVSVNTGPSTSDLSITLVDAPDPAVAGNAITYTATVANLGPGTAHGVTVRAAVPAGASLVSAAAPGGCILSGTPTCAIGTIDNGNAPTATFVVRSAAVGTIAFGATVSGNVLDAVAANNAATSTTVVSPAPPAIVTQPVSVTALAGQETSFSVSADGSPPLSYQWQLSTDSGASWTDIFSFTPIPYMDPGTPVLRVTQVTHAMNGYRYRCVVTNIAGTSTSSAAVLTVPIPPVIAAVTPPGGITRGGTFVTITGSGFVSASAITFDGLPATDVVFLDSTRITARTPAMTVGAKDVRVINPDGQSNVMPAGFTVVEPVDRSADLNGDGEVDVYDAAILTACLNQTPAADAACASADLDYDGTVTVKDLDLLKASYGQAMATEGLVLEGASPSRFNATGATIAFRVAGGQLDVATVGVFRNGMPVTESALVVGTTTITLPAALQTGANEVVVNALTPDGESLRAEVTLWAGSLAIGGRVLTESGSAIAGATVTAMLGSDEQISHTVATGPDGRFFFANLPPNTIVLTASTADNRFGSSIVRGDSGTANVIVSSIGEPSPLDNNDFSQGTAGWNLAGAASLTLEPHVEGPIASAAPAAAASTNLDLRIRTVGQGPQSVSRTFATRPGRKNVVVRYRFITSEIPGGYFGTEFDDGFTIILRSRKTGRVAVESQTMNALGRGAFDGNGATVWRQLSLPVDPSGDVVRLDASVFNVADGKLDSSLLLDFIVDQQLAIVEQRLFDIDKTPLRFLSAAPHDYYGGDTQVYGVVTIDGDPADALVALTLEVVYNGVVRASADLDPAAKSKLLLKPFGSTGRLSFSSNPPQRLFLFDSTKFSSLAGITTDETVMLQLRATTASGLEVTQPACVVFGPCDLRKGHGGKIQILTRYTGADRYPHPDKADCIFKPTVENRKKWPYPYPCGGDDWALPTVTAFISDYEGLLWGDFSNMNGGAFPSHASHDLGKDVDGFFAGYNPKTNPVATAETLLDLLKDPDTCRIQTVWVTPKSTYSPNSTNPFWKAINNVVISDGRKAQDVIKYWPDHAGHFHWRFKPVSQCKTPPPSAQAAVRGNFERRVPTPSAIAESLSAPATLVIDSDAGTPGVQGSRAIPVGGTVVADVFLDSAGQSVAGYDLAVAFDSRMLTLQTVERAGALAGPDAYEILNDIDGDVGRAAVVLAPGSAVSAGAVMRLTFTAVASGLSSIGVTLTKVAGPGGVDVAVTTAAAPEIEVLPPAGCTYTVTPEMRVLPVIGGNSSLVVTAPAGCSWFAASTDSWITILGAESGSGNGVVTFSAASNVGGSARRGRLVIAGRNVTILERGGAPADFDGDGAAERAVFRPSTGTWLVGGTVPRVWGTAGDVPVAADYDGDGAIDRAVFRPATGEWLIDGGVTIQWGLSGDVPVAADYDGDGRADPAVFRTWQGRGALWYVLGQESIAFGLRGDIPVPADYDADGRADPAVYRPSTGVWYVAYSNPDAAAPGALQWGLPGDIPVPADFDGDGRVDLAVFRPSIGMWWVRFSASGFATSASYQWGRAGDLPLALDLDRDGISELLVFRPSDGTWWSMNLSTGATSAVQHGASGDIPIGANPSVAASVSIDADGDGRTDFNVFRPSDGNWFTLIPSTGATAALQWGLPDDVPAPGDYDGDRRMDAAIYRPSNGQWWLRFSGSGFTSWRVEQWGLTGDMPIPADFDGDGRTDLAVFRPSSGQWWIRFSAGDYATFTMQQWGLPGDLPVPGDYDADGRTDFAVFRPSTGIWWVLTRTGAVITHQWGLAGDIPLRGDFDGDRRADFAVYRPSDGTWYVLDRVAGTFTLQRWGLPGDTPVPGDYDGDGLADVAVYRESDGNWYVIPSASGVSFVRQWGLPGDVPIRP